MEHLDSNIKEQIQGETWRLPDALDKKIETLLENLPEYKMKKRKGYRTLLVAATLAVTSSAVWAATVPEVQQTIKTYLSYFGIAKELTYTSDQQLIEKYTRGIKLSTKDKGIEFLVEDMVIDDSYLYIFYKVHSEDPIDYPIQQVMDGDESVDLLPCMDVHINGKEIRTLGNSFEETYLEDAHSMCGVKRISLAIMPIEKEFEVELEVVSVLKQEGDWCVKARVDREAIQSESRSIDLNLKQTVVMQDGEHRITIDKIVLSPLGSQIVISEDIKDYKGLNSFILLDDKGEVLSLVHHGMNVKKEGKVTNAFEFIGADSNMKQIKFIPVQKLDDGLSSVPKLIDLSKLPSTVPIGDEGKIIIHQVQIRDNTIKVQYEKKGIMLDRGPLFSFYDSDQEDKAKEIAVIDPALMSGEETMMSLDRANGIYTRILEVDTGRGKKEDLSKAKFMEIFAANEIKLLEDQTITIDLNTH